MSITFPGTPAVTGLPAGHDTTAGAGDGASVLRDPADAAVLDRLIAEAKALVPLLREEQAATEERGYYSQEIHEKFAAAGFYDILRPKRYGGLELGVAAFNRVAIEVARGCLSTAWCLGQASGHNLLIASYWPERVQEEIFTGTPHVLAPGSAQSVGLSWQDVDGGMIVNGKYQYSSGSPYSTHFLGMFGAWVTGTVDKNTGAQNKWFIATRDQYEVLDDWGAVMGLKGSGSQSILLTDAFIPDERIIDGGWVHEQVGPTPGSRLHGNGLFAGVFQGLDEPGIAGGAVGAGYAAIDEYVRVISKSKIRGKGTPKADEPDFQRTLGIAMAYVDAAASTVIRAGQLYDQFADRNHRGAEPFTGAKAFRLHEAAFLAERLVFDAIVLLMRSAGSSAVVDGAKLQRYYRDITTMTTRVDQFEFDALLAAQAYLGRD